MSSLYNSMKNYGAGREAEDKARRAALRADREPGGSKYDPMEYQGPESAATHQAHLNRENNLNHGSGQVGNPYHDKAGKFTSAASDQHLSHGGYHMTRDPGGPANKKVSISHSGKLIAQRGSFTAAMRTIDKMRKSP